MAYTYQDFQSYLPMAGLTEQDFSAEDLKLAQSNPTAGVKLLEAKADWKNAKTDDERALANSAANQIRSQAGYSGGIDGMNGNVSLTPDDMMGGSQPVQQPVGQTSFGGTAPTYNAPNPYQNQYSGQQNQLLGDMMNYQPFQYGEYNNKYSGQQDKMLNDITNYAPFSFDAENNQQMQAYTKQYAREGNRAMQDTLGSLSSMTGGMPSTAAMTAAGQANDYYMGQLNDKLPQIYESEYNKYLQDFGMLQDKFGAVNQMEGMDYSRYWDGKNFDYGKYLDDFNRMGTNLNATNTLERADRGNFESDRNFGLDLYGQQRNDFNTDRNFEYGKDFDERSWNRDAEQTNYNREQDTWEKEYKFSQASINAEQTEFNQMMDMWKASGRANNQVAQYFGVEPNTAYGGEGTELALEATRADIAYRNKSTAYIGVDKGGSSGIDEARINTAYSNVQNGTETGSDIAILKKAGYSDAQIAAIKGDGGTSDVDAAFSRLTMGSATDADIAALKAAGYTDEQLAEWGWTGDSQGETSDTGNWQEAYDPYTLTYYKINNESDIDKLLESGKYRLEKGNKSGLLRIIPIR